MKLSFYNVVPLPLEAASHRPESIWNSTFSLECPQKVILHASSGSGKSTFINIIYGLRSDYSGRVTVDETDIATFSLDRWTALRKDRISSVFQDLQLFPKLTVWENVLLKNNLTHHRTENQVETMLERLGILDKRQQSCGLLSLGQQQRVAIVRSLLQPFQWLLMDEPFSHLDDENTRLALRLITEETDRNRGGFILTTLNSDYGMDYDRTLAL